jgi:hypothetical protein
LSTDLEELRDRLRSVRREVENTATEISNLEDYFKLDMGTTFGLPSTHPSSSPCSPPIWAHIDAAPIR